MGKAFFVYVREARHLWRFVYHAPDAESPDAALTAAINEALEMGNEPAEQYMAVPHDAITTAEFQGKTTIEGAE